LRPRKECTGFSERLTVSEPEIFNDQDFKAYLSLMSEWCLNYKVDIWAYCLMPNHIHLIAVPETKDGLNLAVGKNDFCKAIGDYFRQTAQAKEARSKENR
jgi:hypothetical protein